ncbi:MAG: hypothetical protein HXS54_14115 [Theionarchaea archaeon]|nr:hypothetical protein [Theionarchaea archaeon]
MDFAGRWADNPEEKIKELTEELETMRDSTEDRILRFSRIQVSSLNY